MEHDMSTATYPVKDKPCTRIQPMQKLGVITMQSLAVREYNLVV